MPEALARSTLVREQYGLALNGDNQGEKAEDAGQVAGDGVDRGEPGGPGQGAEDAGAGGRTQYT